MMSSTLKSQGITGSAREKAATSPLSSGQHGYFFVGVGKGRSEIRATADAAGRKDGDTHLDRQDEGRRTGQDSEEGWSRRRDGGRVLSSALDDRAGVVWWSCSSARGKTFVIALHLSHPIRSFSNCPGVQELDGMVTSTISPTVFIWIRLQQLQWPFYSYAARCQQHPRTDFRLAPAPQKVYLDFGYTIT
jgi:hypothetical protein